MSERFPGPPGRFFTPSGRLRTLSKSNRTVRTFAGAHALDARGEIERFPNGQLADVRVRLADVARRALRDELRERVPVVRDRTGGLDVPGRDEQQFLFQNTS